MTDLKCNRNSCDVEVCDTCLTCDKGYCEEHLVYFSTKRYCSDEIRFCRDCVIEQIAANYNNYYCSQWR